MRKLFKHFLQSCHGVPGIIVRQEEDTRARTARTMRNDVASCLLPGVRSEQRRYQFGGGEVVPPVLSYHVIERIERRMATRQKRE